MRIVVDCRYAQPDRHNGISRYTVELVRELALLHDVTMLISDRRQLALLPSLPWERITRPNSIFEPFVAFLVNRLQPDVVFSPMQTMGSLGRRYRLVLSVHDVICYRHPTPPNDTPAVIRLLWRLYHLTPWRQRRLLQRADAVVTVSETTREILRRYKSMTRPIVVVPNAAGEPDEASAALAASLPDRSAARSLVYMGSFMPHKNVESLARAMRLLPDYELHFMSRASDETVEMLRSLAPTAKLVFHQGASDEECRATFARATAVVGTSRDEGFGIPLVEAMSLGTPIVVSDIPIFREVGGDAAVYVDPLSAKGIADGVRVLEDSAVWRKLSARARERAATYSWRTSARALFTLLSEVGRR
ncbi:glycosyltransferase family 4 protein [Rathayibacter toxicus]|uniref:glycosyltransferase family 4 protein n=1 Tax=Rathayibacter toxicus TaxID=145458 RepID=UPI001C046D2A|nr:glycosyltransferase family 1 protein [Rathayibacter toxicus]QWL32283.1 glycosyltransferase family 1 protein [Rathayibacter toxicus]QWL34376.1 glycosyltransferase family 1 protein [Rathayibacter toxicus]QWL36508.1 glycosyltransferase family 1 protein [Rathayibacter toxicus]QWL38599.1 glycosyltransferase family 1 protein [Rathayibacter toxicus]QWL40687.1 glycosyltransferase family 1 protein [Rathayibacter toxicus]